MKANEKFFRITVNGKGIYEAVEQDCLKDDPRREGKPDGSWLKKVGQDFPGAVSYWTQKGLERYKESGLFDWHKSVINGAVTIEEVDKKPKDVLYEDEYQVITAP
ncbi:MAG: hypothetical protein WDZ90_00630 [Candidatus Paceibacterota bacterium]